MAATLDLTVVEPNDVFGKRRVVIGKYTGPTSYPNGADDGDPLLPAELGLGSIDIILFENPDDNGASPDMRAVKYNTSTQRVLWFTTSDGEQVANGTNLSSFSCRFVAIGR